MESRCNPCRRPLTAERTADLARRFKAMADPTRLAILSMLESCEDSLCACEIEASFDLSQPTISHHLRQLKSAGLVEAERRGSWMHFRLSPPGLEAVHGFASELLSSLSVEKSSR